MEMDKLAMMLDELATQYPELEKDAAALSAKVAELKPEEEEEPTLDEEEEAPAGPPMAMMEDEEEEEPTL
jgi:hypothetical protein